MNLEDYVTVNVACQSTKTYHRLFLNMAERYGVKVVKIGQYTYVLRSDIEKLRPRIDEWKNRPRLSQPASA